MSRAVMQQALEALIPLANAASPNERECLTDEDHERAAEALEALCAALAEPEPVAWVELTDEEQLELARDSMGKSRHWLVAQVEAALKEKNSAPAPRKPQTTHWEGCEAVHPECKKPDTDCHAQGICQRSGYSIANTPRKESTDES